MVVWSCRFVCRIWLIMWVRTTALRSQDTVYCVDTDRQFDINKQTLSMVPCPLIANLNEFIPFQPDIQSSMAHTHTHTFVCSYSQFLIYIRSLFIIIIIVDWPYGSFVYLRMPNARVYDPHHHHRNSFISLTLSLVLFMCWRFFFSFSRSHNICTHLNPVLFCLCRAKRREIIKCNL